MEWCRLYGEMLDDPKVGTLDDASFRTWIELLMVATKADAGGNTKLTAEGIDWVLRRNASVTLHELLQRELVALNESNEIVINAWGDRQKKGDSSAERVAKFRENQRLRNANADVTLQERDGNALDKSREEKSREEKKQKTKRALRFDAQAHLESLGVDPKISSDWIQLRKDKRAYPTETAISDIAAEAAKAGIALQDALKMSCSRGWQGFKAEWVVQGGARASPPRSYHDDRADVIAQLTGRKPAHQTDGVVDVDSSPRRLGS
jgi:hypothetical protein